MGGAPVQHSVIIVNHNGGQALADCLAGVCRDLPPEAEVVLVDNASTDGSADSAAARFPGVRLERAGANLGFAAGANLGARAARGQRLIFLNPDTLVESGWLEALCAPLAEPGVGLSTARVVLLDRPDTVNACGTEVHLSGLTLCRGLGRPRAEFTRAERVAAVSGAACAVRRETFEALGGFDPDFFMYMEDTDLSWRAWLAGWACALAPDSVVRHAYTLRFGPRKVFHQERNRYLMLLKCLRWPTLLALAPALLLAEVVTWGFVLLRQPGGWRGKLQAYGWVLGHGPEIGRRRAGVQALRRARDRDLLRRTGFRLDMRQAAPGWLGRLAGWVFDPLFWLLRGLALALVWW